MRRRRFHSSRFGRARRVFRGRRGMRRGRRRRGSRLLRVGYRM